MIKVFALICALLFVLVTASASFAAESPAAGIKAEQKAPREKILSFEHGEVKAVDPAAKTLTARNKRGEKTFEAESALLSGIKVGETVSVKYVVKDKKYIARSIKKIEKKEPKKLPGK